MDRSQQCLSRLFCQFALVVCFATVAHAQPENKSGPPPSTPCVTRTKLHCEIYGRGDPILFLHGLGGTSYSWRYMVPAFSETHQVILIDLRGQGDSPKPHDKRYSILDQRDLIYEFIIEHNLKRLTLVGNSYGGAVSLLVSLELLEKKQDRLANLILIDSAAFSKPLPLHLVVLRTPILGWLAVHLLPPKCQASAVLRDSYYDPAKVTHEQIVKYAKPISDPGGRYALLQLGKQAIPKLFGGYIARYKTIEVPTLILWGDADHILHPDYGEKLKAALPNPQFAFVLQAGHIPQEEQPDDVICHIKRFLIPNTICVTHRVLEK